MPTSWPAHCMALGTSLSFMKPPNEGSEVIPNICTPFSLPFIRFRKCSLGGELTRVTSYVFGQFHPKFSLPNSQANPTKGKGTDPSVNKPPGLYRTAQGAPCRSITTQQAAPENNCSHGRSV